MPLNPQPLHSPEQGLELIERLVRTLQAKSPMLGGITVTCDRDTRGLTIRAQLP